MQTLSLAVDNNLSALPHAIAEIHDVEFYMDKFRRMRKESAESIIELSATLSEAERLLDKQGFQCFCDRVGVAKGKSYHKKLRCIGRKEHRLRGITDLLPNCWTTIFKLCCLDETDFQSLLDDEIIKPQVTAKAIDEYLDGFPSDRGRPPKRRVSHKITLTCRNLSREDKLEILSLLDSLKKRLGIKVIGDECLYEGSPLHEGGVRS